jgi:hypothetical protein
MLLRKSLPFPPYGLRIAQEQDLYFPLEDYAARYLPISHYCPTWDDKLRRARLVLSSGPKTKRGKFGKILEVPLAERRLCDFYEIKWVSTFGTVELDQLLRRRIPR